MNQEEGVVFFEELIRPMVEICRKLRDEKNPGRRVRKRTIGLVLLVQADSAKELGDLITGLSVGPRRETEVTPLITFEDRKFSIQRRLGASRREHAT